MILGPHIYRAAGTALTAALLPFFLIYSKCTGIYQRNLRERLGLIPLTQGTSARPRFWMHAVSLGEVKVAASIHKALRRIYPSAHVTLSTFTEHGRGLAEGTLGKEASVVYAPLDVPWAVRRSLRRARPEAVIFLETELWPSWISECGRSAVKTVLANGRISSRSYSRYMKIRPFLKAVLREMEAFSMISEKDAQRIICLGAPEKRVSVNGNAKYDLLLKAVELSDPEEVRDFLSVGDNVPVIVAGSTRSGEEELILSAFSKIRMSHPDAMLILAPRHISRTEYVCRILEARGFDFYLWSALKDDRHRKARRAAVVIDTFGDLFDIYSAATVAFCGGSLVPLGGQNPLEPAAWGKPVLHGPSMEDFQEALELLEGQGGSMLVRDAESLADRVVNLIERPEELARRGDAAKRALLLHSGAADRHASVIASVVEKAGYPGFVQHPSS